MLLYIILYNDERSTREIFAAVFFVKLSPKKWSV